MPTPRCLSPPAHDVRYWLKADMLKALTNVCFEGKNGHDADLSVCRLLTLSGHRSMDIVWPNAICAFSHRCHCRERLLLKWGFTHRLD